MAGIVELKRLDVRKDFPFFARNIVYLDSAATAQKPRIMLDAMDDFYEKHNANVHRGVSSLAEEATTLYEAARKTVAGFIGATAREIVFTRNATEAINLISRTWGEANVKKGDTILLTQMEHHSNIVPWQELAKRKGARLAYVPITKAGELDDRALELELRKKPAIFAFTHISNVLGTVNPVCEILDLARECGVPVLVDASQSIAHQRIDIRGCGADFLVFSGHKLYGPHVGVLFGKRGLLEKMEPFLHGGDMIKEVSFEGATWNDVPWRFEAGTPNIAGAIGLAASIRYIESIGIDAIWAHEREITRYAMDSLKTDKSVTIYGPVERAGVISFNLGDMHAHDVASVLDEQGICVRAGTHCAQPLMGVLGIPACVRISFGMYTTKADIDSFLGALLKAKKVFGL